MSLSAGYYKVTKSHLREIGKINAEKFILSMFNCGGRIGHHEYLYWKKWIEENL